MTVPKLLIHHSTEVTTFTNGKSFPTKFLHDSLPDVETVWRALDREGERVAEEETGDVGARHRSAYRLCGALPGAVAVVVSQDGGVRWVCQRDGRVTYWEQE